MYINTPYNYTGSKFKLLPQILPHFDYTKTKFVDLFTGGGSVYTNVLDKYEQILANDIIKELIGIHQSLLESNDIVDKVKEICPKKDQPEVFSELRDKFNVERKPEQLWALMLSCTSNLMRFNQKFNFNQTFGKRSYNSSTEEKVNEWINHARKYKDKINYSSKHFTEVPFDSDTFVYADPPYSNTEAGYNSYWLKDDDTKLYNYLKEVDKCGGTFAISGVMTHDGVSCRLLEDLAKEYKVIYLDYDYNKVSRNGEKETKEVLITNVGN